MKKTRIIAAFPATGKSTLSKTNPDKYLDLDSSSFSKLENGSPNPEFPNNYIEAIKGYVGKVDYILVSTHDVVRQALHDAELCWSLVLPKTNLKAEWIGRCYIRGNESHYIDNLMLNWDSWVQMDPDQWSCAVTRLDSNEYLADAMPFLSTTTYT